MDLNIDLQSAANDYLAALARSASGAIPFAGTFVGELITNIIPNQRIERITQYILLLEKRLKSLEVDIASKMKSPENIELFEEGCWQATRALSIERKKYIAAIVGLGISRNAADHIRSKKLLSILQALNDIEILFLFAYSKAQMGDSSTFESHPELIPPPAYLGTPSEVIEESQMCDIYKKTLVEWGLLRENYPFLKRGEMPEFDRTKGKFKSSGYEITPFGRMFIEWLSLNDEEKATAQ